MLTQRCLVQGRKSTTLNNWNHFPPFYYSFFDFEQCFSTIAQSAYVTYFPYCHWSLLLDQTLLWLGREGIKKREEGKRCVCGRGGGGRGAIMEVINRGTAIIRGKTVLTNFKFPFFVLLSCVVCLPISDRETFWEYFFPLPYIKYPFIWTRIRLN